MYVRKNATATILPTTYITLIQLILPTLQRSLHYVIGNSSIGAVSGN